jgi:D-psicose/D-tagatose/L-ribulose 3-epimerase
MADAARLAISNIAWEPDEDDAIADVLRRAGVTGVELAPTKWRERPFEASAADVAAYRRSWEDRGLRVVSLQSLLFGRPDLQLFGDDATRAALSDFLRRIIDFGAALGAHALVFGSPKNRLRGTLTIAEAADIAAPFLRELGEHADQRGIAFCIEANPPEYGCDFVTTTSEAIALCARVDHPRVRINADLGGMTMAGEHVSRSIHSANDLIAHMHASEPHLVELGSAAAGADHSAAARALKEIGYGGWLSIEMRAWAGGGNVAAVQRALRLAKGCYE